LKQKPPIDEETVETIRGVPYAGCLGFGLVEDFARADETPDENEPHELLNLEDTKNKNSCLLINEAFKSPKKDIV